LWCDLLPPLGKKEHHQIVMVRVVRGNLGLHTRRCSCVGGRVGSVCGGDLLIESLNLLTLGGAEQRDGRYLWLAHERACENQGGGDGREYDAFHGSIPFVHTGRVKELGQHPCG
jgi:hypothetical protein